MVHKGAGSKAGGTEIFMDKKKVSNGRYIFEIKPSSVRASTITTVAANAQRETFQIQVEDATSLSVGQRIILRSDSVEFAKTYYALQKIDASFTRLLKTGFRLRELHTVAAINEKVGTYAANELPGAPVEPTSLKDQRSWVNGFSGE